MRHKVETNGAGLRLLLPGLNLPVTGPPQAEIRRLCITACFRVKRVNTTVAQMKQN